ncbi:MAG TPA: hypothetical protein VK982_14345, partial [Bacteroidales bacterium]|nr:hypothetical protein [Bacteroidales bacterium]
MTNFTGLLVIKPHPRCYNRQTDGLTRRLFGIDTGLPICSSADNLPIDNTTDILFRIAGIHAGNISNKRFYSFE